MEIIGIVYYALYFSAIIYSIYLVDGIYLGNDIRTMIFSVIAFLIYTIISGYWFKRLNKRLALKDKKDKTAFEMWVYCACSSIMLIVPLYICLIAGFIVQSYVINISTFLFIWTVGLVIYMSRNPMCYIFMYTATVGFAVTGFVEAIDYKRPELLILTVASVIFYKLFKNY